LTVTPALTGCAVVTVKVGLMGCDPSF
jgi:hypothetical protein